MKPNALDKDITKLDSMGKIWYVRVEWGDKMRKVYTVFSWYVIDDDEDSDACC
jgi:hypothetical protein